MYLCRPPVEIIYPPHPAPITNKHIPWLVTCITIDGFLLQGGTTLYQLTTAGDAISWSGILVIALLAVGSVLPVAFKNIFKKKFEWTLLGAITPPYSLLLHRFKPPWLLISIPIASGRLERGLFLLWRHLCNNIFLHNTNLPLWVNNWELITSSHMCSKWRDH